MSVGEVVVKIDERVSDGIVTSIKIQHCSTQELFLIGQELIDIAKKRMLKDMLKSALSDGSHEILGDILKEAMKRAEADPDLFPTKPTEQKPMTKEQLTEVLRRIEEKEKKEG